MGGGRKMEGTGGGKEGGGGGRKDGGRRGDNPLTQCEIVCGTCIPPAAFPAAIPANKIR